MAFIAVLILWLMSGEKLAYIVIGQLLEGKIGIVSTVPLYNAEKFIRTLMSSLFNQKTAYIFQIILIDDGSSDGAKELIDKYLMGTKHHVEYIEIKHGGLSSARNAGLRIAKGNYVGFIDADDYIDEYYVEKLLNAAYENDADIVKCGTVSIKNGVGFLKDCHDDEIIEGKMKEKIMNYNSYAWGGVFRRELLDVVKSPES